MDDENESLENDRLMVDDDLVLDKPIEKVEKGHDLGSLIDDFNELVEKYNAVVKLNAAYENAIQELQRSYDVLLRINSDLAASLRSTMETTHPVPDGVTLISKDSTQ